MQNKFDVEQIRAAVTESNSLSQVLRQIGVSNCGTNMNKVKSIMKEHNLSLMNKKIAMPTSAVVEKLPEPAVSQKTQESIPFDMKDRAAYISLLSQHTTIIAAAKAANVSPSKFHAGLKSLDIKYRDHIIPTVENGLLEEKTNTGKKIHSPSQVTKPVPLPGFYSQNPVYVSPEKEPVEDYVLLQHTLSKVKNAIQVSFTLSEAAARLGAIEGNLQKVIDKYNINTRHFKTTKPALLGVPKVDSSLDAEAFLRENRSLRDSYKPKREFEDKEEKKTEEQTLMDVWNKYSGKIAGPWEFKQGKPGEKDVYIRKASNGKIIGQVNVLGPASYFLVFEGAYDEFYSLSMAQKEMNSQLEKRGFFLMPGKYDSTDSDEVESKQIANGLYRLKPDQTVVIKDGFVVIK